MPLHDWTDDRGWDSVHPVWLTYLLEDVQERLPEGYKAFLRRDASLTFVPDHDAPDVSTLNVEDHEKLIAALELVSPRNKDRPEAKETYTNRYLGYLRLGVHLLLVDVLPRPRGFSFSDAITTGLGLALTPQPAPFAAAYRVGEAIPVGDDMGSLVGLWRRALGVGQPLPMLPLPLTVHQAVPVNLEETYRRATKRVYLD